MTNDNNELKNNAPCEEKREARQLSEEELEQVYGGLAPDIESADCNSKGYIPLGA